MTSRSVPRLQQKLVSAQVWGTPFKPIAVPQDPVKRKRKRDAQAKDRRNRPVPPRPEDPTELFEWEFFHDFPRKLRVPPVLDDSSDDFLQAFANMGEWLERTENVKKFVERAKEAKEELEKSKAKRLSETGRAEWLLTDANGDTHCHECSRECSYECAGRPQQPKHSIKSLKKHYYKVHLVEFPKNVASRWSWIEDEHRVDPEEYEALSWWLTHDAQLLSSWEHRRKKAIIDYNEMLRHDDERAREMCLETYVEVQLLLFKKFHASVWNAQSTETKAAMQAAYAHSRTLRLARETQEEVGGSDGGSDSGGDDHCQQGSESAYSDINPMAGNARDDSEEVLALLG